MSHISAFARHCCFRSPLAAVLLGMLASPSPGLADNPLRSPPAAETSSAKPAATDKPDADQKQLLAQRDELWKAAIKLADEDKFSEAIAAGRTTLSWQQEHLGDQPAKTSTMLEGIAIWQECTGDFVAALATWRELTLARSASDQSWKAARPRLRAGVCERACQLADADRKKLARAAALTVAAERQITASQHAQAIESSTAALEIRAALLGPDDFCTSINLHNAGTAHGNLGHAAQARTLLEQCVNIRERVCGPAALPTLATLSNLATTYTRLGETELAEKSLQRVADGYTQIYGEKHAKTVEAVAQLAKLRQKQLLARRNERYDAAKKLADEEKFAEAIAAHRETLSWQQQQLADQPSKANAILEDLANWQECTGDFAGASKTWCELEQHLAHASADKAWDPAIPRLRADACNRACQLTTADREKLARASILTLASMRQSSAKQYASASENASAALDIRAALLGRDHFCTAMSLNQVGNMFLYLGRFADARPPLEECVAVKDRVCGLPNYSTLLSWASLADTYEKLGEYELAEKAFQRVLDGSSQLYGEKDSRSIKALSRLGYFLYDRGRIPEAEAKLLASLQAREAQDLTHDAFYGCNLLRLGDIYSHTGDFDKSRSFFERSLKVYTQLRGDDHIDSANVKVRLAKLEYVEDNHDAAYRYISQAVETLKRIGEKRPETIEAMAQMAEILAAQGDSGQAERIYVRVVDLYVETVGENDDKTAHALSQLSDAYIDWGDFAKADACSRRALAAMRRSKDAAPMDLILAIVGLATVDSRTGKYEEAQTLLKEASDLAHSQPKPNPTVLVAIQFAQQIVNERSGKIDHEQQEKVDQQVSDDPAINPMLKAMFEDRKARTALENLKYQDAVDHAERAMQAYQKMMSPLDSDWSRVLLTAIVANLGLHHDAEAKSLADHAMAIARHELDAAAMAQSERQQLAYASGLRQLLELYLALPGEVAPVDDVYAHAIFWKGAVQARQIRKRRNLQQDLAPQVAQHQQISAKLTSLTLKTPDPAERDAWQQQLNQLKEQKDKLEGDLAYAAQQAGPASIATPEQIRDLLPDGVALVDIFQYSRIIFPNGEDVLNTKIETRFVAFVSRHDRPTVRVELGLAEPINQAVDLWRSKCLFKSDGLRAEPAVQLRQLVWNPLETHLDGCQTVLISPDANLSRIPLGALPGRDPGTYLIEDVAIGIIPVPQLLPDLMSAPSPATVETSKESLLLVGNIDYDAGGAPSTAESGDDLAQTRHAALGNFGALKSAAAEIESVSNLFRARFSDRQLLVLDKVNATEAAFRSQAPQHRWLVIATHGFFAPPSAASAMAAQDQVLGLGGDESATDYSGVLSGLALAGANTAAGAGGDDGILTAFEVSSLDLRSVDLAVLSGCETGLGKVTSGEGAMGLQRAFQVAGARSTVASLWSVPDQKTSQLMQRFYTNLWDKHLSKLEALREAQLWMMRTAGKPGNDGAAAANRLPPYHWAAFVLSGQWQ